MDRLDEIRAFAAVADARSFTQGARKTGISGAQASKLVARLEDRLGARLLNRTTRDVSLTDTGQAYLERARRKGLKVAQAHFRYLNPMPKNTAEVLAKYKKVLVPELNNGQLSWLLRAKYLAPAQGLNKIQGRPFLVSEIEAAIEKALS